MKILRENKQQLKNIAWIVVGGLIGVNCINTYSIKVQNEDLRSELTNLRQEIRNVNGSVSSSLYEQRNEIEKLLTKQQSLFTKTLVDIKLKSNQFEVTMQVIPKAINKGEKITARIIANGKTYEQQIDENYKAVLNVDITDRIEPILIIQSNEGTKQEALETQYTDEAFQDMVNGEWRENEKEVYCQAWIAGDIKAEDIVSAAFVIEQTDTVIEKNEGYGFGSSSASESSSTSNGLINFPTHEREGIIVPAQRTISQEREDGLVYEGDFSQYMLKGDGTVYNVHFEITTKDGVKYINTENPIATFYSYGMGKELHTDFSRLLPILK